MAESPTLTVANVLQVDIQICWIPIWSRVIYGVREHSDYSGVHKCQCMHEWQTQEWDRGSEARLCTRLRFNKKWDTTINEKQWSGLDNIWVQDSGQELLMNLGSHVEVMEVNAETQKWFGTSWSLSANAMWVLQDVTSSIVLLAAPQ